MYAHVCTTVMRLSCFSAYAFYAVENNRDESVVWFLVWIHCAVPGVITYEFVYDLESRRCAAARKNYSNCKTDGRIWKTNERFVRVRHEYMSRPTFAQILWCSISEANIRPSYSVVYFVINKLRKPVRHFSITPENPVSLRIQLKTCVLLKCT